MRTIGELIAGAQYWQGHCIDMEPVDEDAMRMHAYLRDLEAFLRERRDSVGQ